MLHIPLVIILIHHGGGVIHGDILLHISDHIMLSMQLQGDHHVQGNHMLKVTALSIKIGLVLKIRKGLSSKFIEWKVMVAKIKVYWMNKIIYLIQGPRSENSKLTLMILKTTVK
jgi:hypothetical protein